MNPPRDVLQMVEGRHLFGRDPTGYEVGRPDCPPFVYDDISDRCGLAPGAKVFEVGPGTGIVTRRLLSAGTRVVAVEPDPSLASYLRESSRTDDLQICRIGGSATGYRSLVSPPVKASGVANHNLGMLPYWDVRNSQQ